MMDGRFPNGATLADVGGGTGVAAHEAFRLAPPGAYVRRVVLDAQRGMLVRGARGSSPASATEWVRGTGSRLPLADGSVDLVLSLGVLCCMESADVPRAVSELHRVVRPGGYCLLGLPRGWAAFAEPLFVSAGFRRAAQQRPGRVLYQRPPLPPVPTAVARSKPI